MDELKRWSAWLNKPMNFTPAFFPVDCSLVSKMVLAAGNNNQDAGAFSDAVLTAVWNEEKNVSDESTIIDIANACGLDGQGLIASAQSDALAEQFQSVTDEAHNADVFGSPTYIYNGEIFWGQDRLDFLDRALA